MNYQALQRKGSFVRDVILAMTLSVIPAKAGIQGFIARVRSFAMISFGSRYILSPGYSSVSHATHSPRRLAEEPSERSIRRLAFTFYIFSFTFIFALCSLLFAFNFSLAHAASAASTFTTSLTTSGVVDTTPPSIPTGLVATPISQSEIDLVWSLSTDNVAVGGYVVFRDSSPIATTTSTNYADTFLTASTTYTYMVQAFDTSYNYSALSAPVSTSTLPIPPTPTSTIPVIGQGSTSSGSSLIYNVHISADSGNAIVSFLTNVPAQSTTVWGLTPDYEIGSISSVLYDISHQVTLSGLSPETHYYVRITANAANGSQSSFITEFTTAGLPGTPLPNPSNFSATPTANAIDISWTNTTDPRATEVRIVRSETFFPSDQFDGVPIYEGPGQSFRDTSAVAGKTYYYAIFSEGVSSTGVELFSSGALAKARIPLPGEIVSFATSSNPFAGITFTTTNPMIAGLTLADFQFIQESKQLAIAGNNIIGVNGEENMTIRLPYNKVPQILKTIAVTLNDPTDPSKAFIFLLRANDDKTYYEASIGPLGRTGIFPLTITILDYQNQGLKQLEGSLAALAIGAYPSAKEFNPTWLWIGFALFIILLIIAAILNRRRREGKMERSKDEKNKVAVPVIQTQIFSPLLVLIIVLTLPIFLQPNTAHALTAGPNTPGTMSTTTISGGTKDWNANGGSINNAKIEDGIFAYAGIGAIGKCVASDTIISTKEGNKQIKDLKIGDLVYSYNFASEKIELKKVLSIINGPLSLDNDEWYHVYFTDGDIKATFDHPFYVNGQFIEAKDLKVGDELFDMNGRKEVIQKITIEKNYTDYSWNIVVEDNHNYFANDILVHNVGITLDNSVQLIQGGTIGSNDEAASTTSWGTTLATSTYGGSGDLWGKSWTASDISTSTFGVAIAAQGSGWSPNYKTYYLLATNFGFSIPTGSTINGIQVRIKKAQNFSCGGVCLADIDTINITVYYTPAASASNFNNFIVKLGNLFQVKLGSVFRLQ